MKNKKLYFIIYNLIVSLFLFVIIEVSFDMLLNNPKHIPSALLPNIREYYLQYDRNIIQFLDECSTYDSTTYYRLRPGHFKFSNREFDIDFDVNTIGVRDDEISLDKPEIIVLGDSHAMGWGVEQDSTFANLLEINLGCKVLNTGISSYGAAREIKLLNDINTDSLKFLIIQYCSNDYQENKLFFDNKNELEISSKESYLAICEKHKITRNYYPFKHIIFNCLIWGKQLRKSANSISNFDQKVDPFSAFLNVLLSTDISKIPDDTKIIVFGIDARKSNGEFVKGVKDKLLEKKYSNLKKRITLLDLSSELDETDYFILDDHLNSSGHKVISNSLEKLIKQKYRNDAYSKEDLESPF